MNERTEKNVDKHGLILRVFNASPAMMSLRRQCDWRIVYVNSAWLKTLGYEFSEVVGRSAEELDMVVEPLSRSAWLNLKKEVLVWVCRFVIELRKGITQ